MKPVLTAAFLASSGAAYAQIPLQTIGTLPPPFISSTANGISADGSTTFGSSSQPPPTPGAAATTEPIIWTAARGIESLGSLGGNHGTATAVSADGSIVFGYASTQSSSQNTYLFRWTRASGTQDLGGLQGATHTAAAATSADGAVLCGYGYRNPAFPSFRWTAAGGIQEISTTILAVAISADGSTILGQKSPGYRWTAASGFQPLPPVPLTLMDIAIPCWISSDGSTVLGTVRDPTGDLNAAYRWSAATGYEFLTVPFTQPGMIVDGASADGSLILGRGGFGQVGQLILTNKTVHDAAAYLQDRGADLSGWNFLFITGVSADKCTFVGRGRTAAGRDEGWLVTLPALCYANCDSSTVGPALNVNDFICFQNRYSASDPYANCDASTAPPVLNVNDFTCFLNRFAGPCV